MAFKPLFRSITLKNFLSFGPQSETIGLRPLNVLIGQNGSGKSNLLEAFALLNSIPEEFPKSLRRAGSASDFLFRGEGAKDQIEIGVEIENPAGVVPMAYSLSFSVPSGIPTIEDERVEDAVKRKPGKDVYFYYRFQGGKPVLNSPEAGKRNLKGVLAEPGKSVLATFRDEDMYPALAHASRSLESIQLIRDLGFGKGLAARMVQRTDIAGQRLESDGANLNVVLHRILNSRDNLPEHVFEYVRNIYEGFDRFKLDIVPSGYLQLVAQEGDRDVPANRLSDGTIRFLCLLAVLLEPNPPALLCIDEPDLGLHPDLIRVLADLLVQASKRMQIIASTHNERLIDCLAGNPESILAFDRENGATVVKRLDAKELEPWLKKYSMSELWSRGQLGGTRW